MYAVITGASSGIGEQFAKRLAKEGYDLILVARRRERLTALSDKLKATHKELKCDIFTADLMHLKQELRFKELLRCIRSKTAEKKKLGFPIPIRVWLKEEKYYNIVKEMFESDAAKKFFDTKLLLKMLDDHKNGKNTNEKTDNSRKIWTVYIFLVWYDRFFEHGKPVHPAMSVQ